MPGRIPFFILLISPISLPAASHALHFDGLDDKVRVEPFEHELSAFTIETWVRKTSPTDYYFDTIVSTDQFRFQIDRDNNLEFWDRGGGESFDYRGVPVDGTWHHVAVVWSGGNRTFYLDGEPAWELQEGARTMSLSLLRIGHDDLSHLGWLDPFDGDLDEVRFWNHARSGDEIRRFLYARLSGGEAGLIGYWNFEEASGQGVADLSSSGADGFLGDSPGEDLADPDRIEVSGRGGVAAIPGCGYAPLEASFTVEGSIEPVAVLWDFGDGGTSSELNPTHVYSSPGTYDVSVLLIPGDGSELVLDAGVVRVYSEAPRAAFTLSPRSGPLPLTVQAVSTSTGDVASHLWDFGDGSRSREPNPAHIYGVPGTFEVRLTVTGPCRGAPGNESTATEVLTTGTYFGIELVAAGPRCIEVVLASDRAVSGGELGIAYDPRVVAGADVRPGADFPAGGAIRFRADPPVACMPEVAETGLAIGWLASPAAVGPGRRGILKVCFLPAEGAGAGSCSPLRFVDCLGIEAAPIRNIVTDEDGNSVAITAADAELCFGPEALFRRGDANGDGSFDISDAIMALGCLFAGTNCPGCEEAADANDDGELDISDPLRLLNWRFLTGPEPAAPFAACGIDPTPDFLDCGEYASCNP